MIQDYFFLAYKNLKHRGTRTWLTLLGIVIGVSAVVSLISLGNALQMAVSSQFGISETELISVQAGGISSYGPPRSGAVNPLTQDDLQAIKKISSVERAVGRNIETGKLEYNDKITFGYFTNIPDGEDRDFLYEEIGEDLTLGRFLKDEDVGKVFVGYNFYVDKIGFDKEVIPGKKILINDESFEVVGILDKKGSFIFDGAVFMNSKDMESLFEYGDNLDIISVQAKNSDELDKVKLEIEKVLRKSRNVKEGEEDFEVSTPESSLASVNGILGGIQAFIIVIASISIFIGAIGIVNTMTTSVLERKKEIGVMKSVGARNEDIFFQFFIEAGLLGLIGGAIGIIFGLGIGTLGILGINSFIGSELNPTFNIWLISFSLLGSFLIGAVSGITPAMAAAKQNPVEALRS